MILTKRQTRFSKVKLNLYLVIKKGDILDPSYIFCKKDTHLIQNQPTVYERKQFVRIFRQENGLYVFLFILSQQSWLCWA